MRYAVAFSTFFAVLWTASAQSRSVWDGVFTKQQAGAGYNVFAESCASCHGEPAVGGDSGPALAGEGFRDNYNGMTLADLYDRISTTMPMDAPGTLPAEQYTAVLAYILAENEYPFGDQPLPSDPAALKSIKIEEKK